MWVALIFYSVHSSTTINKLKEENKGLKMRNKYLSNEIMELRFGKNENKKSS